MSPLLNLISILNKSALYTEFVVTLAFSSLAVVLVTWLLAYRLRHTSAASQYCVWQIGLVCTLMLPAFIIAGPKIRLGLLPSPQTARIETLVESEQAAGPRSPVFATADPSELPRDVPTNVASSNAATPGDATTQRQNLPSISASPVSTIVDSAQLRSKVSWIGVVGLSWCLGMLLQLARVGFMTWRVRRLTRRAIPCDDPRLESLIRNFGDVRLSTSHALQVPVATGVFRPQIILPQEAMNWTLQRQQMVLAHELAHIQRRDVVWQLIAQVAAILYWYNPLVWVAIREMKLLREDACDDLVLQSGVDPASYAMCLVDIAANLSQRTPTWICASMAGSNSLESRVNSILNDQKPRQSASVRLRRNLCVVIGAALFAFGAVRPIGEPTSIAEQPPIHAPSQDTSHLTNDQLREQGITRFSGRVVGPSGQPVPNARVRYVEAMALYSGKDMWLRDENWITPKLEAVFGEETTTDSQGNFVLDHNWRDWPARHNNAQSASISFQQMLVANTETQAGWARDVRIGFRDDKTIRLSNRDKSIGGRVVTAEGQPIVGAKVSVHCISGTKSGAYDRWLNDVERLTIDGFLPMNQASMRPSFSSQESPDKKAARFPVYEPIIGPMIGIKPVTTDDTGAFRFAGLGNDQLVVLKIEASGFATTAINALTRMRSNQAAIEAVAPRDNFPRPTAASVNQYLSSDSVVVMPMSQPIVGTIRDSETNAPIGGVWLSAGRGTLRCRSNARGEFRMDGAPAGAVSELRVVTDPHTPYFSRSIDIENGHSTKPIQVDVRLKRGVWIRGSVTNRATGAGQPDVSVHYSPFLSNRYLSAYKAFDPRVKSLVTNSRRFMTDENGQYRLLGIPGRGVVMASCKTGSFLTGVGWESIEPFQKRDERDSVTLAHLTRQTVNAVSLVEITEQDQDRETTVPLEVDSGIQMTLQVVDKNGEEVSEFLFSGQDHRITSPNRPSKSSEISIEGLEIGSPRPVLIQHKERGIGALLELNLDNKSPTDKAIRLLPVAEVRGTIVDEEGRPAKNVQVRVDVLHSIPNYMIVLGQTFTDDAGKFSFDQLLPGGKYRIISMGGPKRFAKLADSLAPEPSETIDLGIIDVTKDERPKPTRSN